MKNYTTERKMLVKSVDTPKNDCGYSCDIEWSIYVHKIIYYIWKAVYIKHNRAVIITATQNNQTSLKVNKYTVINEEARAHVTETEVKRYTEVIGGYRNETGTLSALIVNYFIVSHKVPLQPIGQWTDKDECFELVSWWRRKVSIVDINKSELFQCKNTHVKYINPH